MSSAEVSVPRPKRKIAFRLGGLLTVVMGVLALQNGLNAMTMEDDTTTSQYLSPGILCGSAIIMFGMIALAGGICALMGRHFSLALAGALFGMAGGGWTSFFLGIMAYVLFFISDESF